jgi:hypothetical protein
MKSVAKFIVFLMAVTALEASPSQSEVSNDSSSRLDVSSLLWSLAVVGFEIFLMPIADVATNTPIMFPPIGCFQRGCFQHDQRCDWNRVRLGLERVEEE